MGKLIIFNKQQTTNMKDWKELTREEFDNLGRWKVQMAYTADELMGMVNLSRAFVNPRTPSCLTCASNSRETKEKLMSFYLQHKEEWEIMFAQEADAKAMEAKAVEVKTKTKKK